MILGIGLDLIEINRIEKVGVDRLANRILTQIEREDFFKHFKKKENLAGRFAAKEAISKALGTGIGSLFSFYDVEIMSDERGKPQVHLSSRVKENMFLNKHIKIHLSITHTKGFASSVAILEEK